MIILLFLLLFNQEIKIEQKIKIPEKQEIKYKPGFCIYCMKYLYFPEYNRKHILFHNPKKKLIKKPAEYYFLLTGGKKLKVSEKEYNSKKTGEILWIEK